MKSLKYFQNRKFGAVVLSVLSLLLVLLISSVFNKQVNDVNLTINDSLYNIHDPHKDIIIIGIDDRTTESLGRFSTWNRSIYAKLLDVLNKAQSKAIVFDIFFQSSDGNENDLLFSEALKQSKNVILASLIDDGVIKFPSLNFRENVSLGFALSSPDEDGVHRRTIISFDGKDEKAYSSLAYETYKTLAESSDLDKKIPLDEEGKMYINYFADPFGYKIISFVDVLMGRVPREEFDNKIIFIGLVSFPEVQDFVISPRNNSIYMSGVEMHANILNTLLEKKFLKTQSTFSLLIELIILSIAFQLLISYLKLRYIFIFGLIFLPVYYYSLHILYANGILPRAIQPLLLFFLTYILSFAYRYFISDKQGRELKGAFSKYVSAELVEKISKNPEMVKLGGEKRIITVFFMDIKNSTTLSEKIEITKWVSQLNEYFTMMENVIKARGGTLDKFEGDAIMGFFGAPLEQKDQVLRAFLAALDMKLVLIKLHEKWASEGLPLIEFRIGLNTGEAIVGNVGSLNRFDYTAMGDTVNTASRMEGSVNKTYNTTIIAANFEKHTDLEYLKKYIILREIDSAIMLGKTESTKLYELYCKSNELSDLKRNILEVYAEALKEYQNKNFQKSKTLFDSISETDPPAKAMSERISKILSGEIKDELDENMNFRLNKK